MDKTLTENNQQVKQKPEATAPQLTRHYEAEEFEADTSEERPIALLAEKRRQFLAELLRR